VETMAQNGGANKENISPQTRTVHYVRGTSRMTAIPGVVRDTGILDQINRQPQPLIDIEDPNYRRIMILIRYMRYNMFPGDANMEGSPRYYYGPDFVQSDLESYIDIMNTAQTWVGTMTHDDYLVMRDARGSIMRTMLWNFPNIRPRSPVNLWDTFWTLGDLLHAVNNRARPFRGEVGPQLEAVYQFFNNPQWLPINPDV